MKLRIERHGGFVGKMAAGERDVEDLSSVERQALDTLLKKRGPYTPAPGADRFR